jgi:EAL domain-containing protein (putative c-di-GMP-specific phosphodiesterase class I)
MSYPLDRIELPAGTLLFSEGDNGNAAYLIQSGEVEIFATRDGKDLSLARRGPGDMVGEMAVIVPGRRSASARIIADCILLVVTKAQIGHRVANADPILRLCFGVVTDRYAQTASMLEQLNGPQPIARQPPVSLPEFHSAIEALSVEADLRRAIKANELVPYFQPIIQFGTQRLVGFEALARWRHPERGLLMPDEFIPIAESSGLIVDITTWCLEQAALAIPKMAEAAFENGPSAGAPFLSINVAGDDLVDTPFAARVADMLDKSGVPPQSLKIEVTEHTLMMDPDKAAESLQACQELGVKTAIDDFGTGYSSLAYLTKLPISEIKIAPSFVRSMADDPPTQKIIKMVLRLAEELDLPVIAEGIEEIGEALTLVKMGCAFGQGYLFGRPAPIEQTLHLIRHWTTSGVMGQPRRIAVRGARRERAQALAT